jgi:uncharacterized membrane protein YqaE (UPF0057 family)
MRPLGTGPIVLQLLIPPVDVADGRGIFVMVAFYLVLLQYDQPDLN